MKIEDMTRLTDEQAKACNEMSLIFKEQGKKHGPGIAFRAVALCLGDWVERNDDPDDKFEFALELMKLGRRKKAHDEGHETT